MMVINQALSEYYVDETDNSWLPLFAFFFFFSYLSGSSILGLSKHMDLTNISTSGHMGRQITFSSSEDESEEAGSLNCCNKCSIPDLCLNRLAAVVEVAGLICLLLRDSFSFFIFLPFMKEVQRHITA